MNKILKWSLIVLASLVVLLFVAFQFLKSQTKKSSPESTVEYRLGDNTITVFYNRPSKKGREIFGALVPYSKVWRTGANEATTFTCTKDMNIGGKTLPAGKYTLWTIPEKESWTVIFNTKMYPWGVGGNGASREEAFDALSVQVPSETLSQSVEMFDITFEGTAPSLMVLSWDLTRVAVPLN